MRLETSVCFLEIGLVKPVAAVVDGLYPPVMARPELELCWNLSPVLRSRLEAGPEDVIVPRAEAAPVDQALPRQKLRDDLELRSEPGRLTLGLGAG